MGRLKRVLVGVFTTSPEDACGILAELVDGHFDPISTCAQERHGAFIPVPGQSYLRRR